VQLFAAFEADRIDNKVVVKVIRVAMGSNQHLKLWKLPGGNSKPI